MGSQANPLEFNIIPFEVPTGLEWSRENTGNFSAKDDFSTSSIKSVCHKPLEFVTVTSAKQKRNKEISTVVRTQVMRDYFWKQRNPDHANQAANDHPINPSKYKGRFRLSSQPTKAKPGTSAKKAKGRDRSSNEIATAQKGRRILMPRGPILDLSVYDPDGFFASTPGELLGGSLDPFDSFSLKLKPESLKLIYYYKQSYSNDFLDLNVGGGYCLFDAREHRALFHAILYLVALDFNLRRGTKDDLGCLYHSSEAFRSINEQLQNGIIEDATIAAVALIAAKENLAGMFDISYMHMQGLKYMVQNRGGIHNIKGLHRGVVIWADFCNSSVWNCLPHFPHSSISSESGIGSPSKEPATNGLSQDDVDVESQLVALVQSLRDVSAAKDVQGHKKTEASHVYDIEYRLHLVKASASHRGSVGNEIVPLCTALNTYLYLAIRELPAKAQIIQHLIDQLQASFYLQLTEKPASNAYRQRRILWMLFVGYAAAVENRRRVWFAQSLKSLYAKSYFRDMDQLQGILKSVLWQDSWCEYYFKKLREEVA